jgi:hypothetical protein
MNKEQLKFDKHEDMEKYLYDKYPIIFQDRSKDMSESCMFWGINCGVGWFDLLNKLCEEVQVIADTTGIQLVADQVKEKFATLRFYWHTKQLDDVGITYNEETGKIWYNIIEDIVSRAEERSACTCEDCGEYGKICGSGWLKTLCKTCADKDPRYKYMEDEGI